MSKLFSSTLAWAFVVLFACALFSLPHQASAASITWDGGGDGTTWQSANNWSGNAVPTDSDDVTISANAVTGDGTLDFSSLTVTSTGSLTITGTMSGGGLTIGSGGTVTQKNGNLQTLSGNLDIKSGGTLTHFANSNAKSYYINFSAANITIDVGGSMSALSKGYADGFGPGVGGYGSSYGGGGGAHVGDGGWGWGNGAGAPGTAGYCDLANPSTLGSAGGGGNYSGGVPGGGLIVLNVSGTLTINGTVTAAGSAASNPGGGAGGAINITADTIAGTPSSFSAAGGTATSNGGGGGGGCVLLAYTTANSIAATQVDVSGGDGYNTDGGSGAVMIKQAAQSGDVYFKNRATGGGLSRLTSVPAMKSLTISGYSTYLVSQGQTFTVGTATIGGDGTGALSINGTLSAPNFGTLENLTLKINAGGIFDNAAAFEVKAGSSLYVYATSTVSNAFSLATSGTLYLSRWASLAGITDLVLSGGTTTLVDYTTATALTVDTLTINGNASLTNEVNSASQAHVVNISADTITIRKNGIINVKGRGYGAGVGPGAGGYAGSYGGGGGAHVGNGGLGWGAGAGAPGTGGYCNLTNPQTMGSGGGLGAYQDGSPGGGLVILSVSGVFTIDGSINASGKESTSPGAGGGGAINVTAGSISGTPSLFSVAGGNASSDGGGGGGGCIRINYATTNSITAGMANIAGGHGYNTNGGVGSFSSNKTVNILAPSSPVLGTPTNSSILLSWTSGGGTETVFRLDQSVSGGEYTQVTNVSSATTTYAFTGLSPNLQYVFRVAAGDGVNATSSYATSSAIFTLANAALAPTLGTPATSTVSLTINENSNPATVQYAIYDLTDAKYFTSAGLETSTPTFFPASAWSGAAKGLAAWSSHSFVVVSQNSDGLESATSSASDVTLAAGAITVSEPAIETTEDSSVGTYTLVLTAQPTASVTVSVTPDVGSEVSTSTVVFTTSNWNTPVEVIVTPVVLYDDRIDTIVHAALSADSNYNSIAISSVTNTVTGAVASRYTPTSGGGPVIPIVPKPLYGETTLTISASRYEALLNGKVRIWIRLNADPTTVMGYALSLDSSFVGSIFSPYQQLAFIDIPSSTSATTVFGRYQTLSGSPTETFSFIVPPQATAALTPRPTPTPTSTIPVVVVPSTGNVPTDSSSPVFTPPSAPTLPSTSRDTALESLVRAQVKADAKEFNLVITEAQVDPIVIYIVYGDSPASIKFGQGERRAIIRDYFETVRRTDIVWDDVERLAIGQIPKARNLTAERQTVTLALPTFKDIFGHAPNFKNATENLAWNTLMYRIRFPRDLKKEAQGLKLYRAEYNHDPRSPFGWSVVRVFGYVK